MNCIRLLAVDMEGARYLVERVPPLFPLGIGRCLRSSASRARVVKISRCASGRRLLWSVHLPFTSARYSTRRYHAVRRSCRMSPCAKIAVTDSVPDEVSSALSLLSLRPRKGGGPQDPRSYGTVGRGVKGLAHGGSDLLFELRAGYTCAVCRMR